MPVFPPSAPNRPQPLITRLLGLLRRAKAPSPAPMAPAPQAPAAPPPLPDRIARPADADLPFRRVAIGAPRPSLILPPAPALGPSGAVGPEDGSLRPRVYHMFHDAGDAASAPAIRAIAAIGAYEGFRVEATTHAGDTRRGLPAGPDDLRARLPEAVRGHVTIVAQPYRGDVWTEDSMEITERGEVIVPPKLTWPAGETLGDVVVRDRVRRLYGATLPPRLRGAALDAEVAARYPLAEAFGTQGVVAARETRVARAAGAAAAGRPFREATTYVEGGDMLVGRLPDGRAWGVVGRDTVAVNRAILAGRLGRAPSDREVLDAIARDYGLAPGELTAVEQPGDYHLDMVMLPIGPRRVVLNDAREAARLQAGWMREDHAASKPRPGDAAALAAWQAAGQELERRVAGLMAGAEVRAGFEARAEADLAAAGIAVHRMAGVFRDARASQLARTADKEALLAAWERAGEPSREMNFLNAELATNARGERYMIALGGDPRAEAYVADQLARLVPSGLQHLYLLDRRLTASTLALKGGISCRVKPEGDAVPPAA